MTKLKSRLAAVVAAAILATPTMARESHGGSRHQSVAVEASTVPIAQHVGAGNRVRDYEGHDVWAHWGTYYGPMLPSIP
jgi:hypothetical protein